MFFFFFFFLNPYHERSLDTGLYLHRFWRFYPFVFSAFIHQFEKLYHTLETVLDLSQVSKLSFFNSILGVWIFNETLFLVFDILHIYFLIMYRLLNC